jgi:hypothetical protein
MDTVVAKILIGSDEKSFMQAKNQSHICLRCGTLLSYKINKDFVLKKKSVDLLYTYDHYCIVSQQFYSFCVNNRYENLKFIELPKTNGFFFFQPENVFDLDSERRKIQFINHCDLCNNYQEVIGASPAYAKLDLDVPSDFIYRSNYIFGSKERKNPLIIIGLETEQKMKKDKLKGLYFDNVYL